MPRWLNHPAAMAAAEHKPVQLVHARACGLSVSDTIVTNDPGDAAKFVTRAGRAVYKPLTPVGIIEADTHRVVFTTRSPVGTVG